MSDQYKLMGEIGYGDSDKLFAKKLRGFSTDKSSQYLPPMRVGMGYVFITRPWMNLSYNNMATYRKFMRLYSPQELNSLGNFVRLTLDPILAASSAYRDTPLLDRESPWIMLLTNAMIECNGWPDRTLDIKTSDPGRLKETYTIATGTGRQYESFPLNMTFENPALVMGLLFGAWLDYMGEVHSEEVMPHATALLDNYKDYDVGIWRIVTDETGKCVTSIAFTIGFPNVDANGAMLNYNKREHFNSDVGEYNISFQCDGLMQDDPILPEMFNAVNGKLDTTYIPSADPAYAGGASRTYWTKLESPNHRKAFMDVRLWINTKTNELEFYVRNADYKAVYGSTT